MLTQKQITVMLEGMEAEIAESVKAQVKAEITTNIKYELGASVRKVVQTYLETEIADEVRAALVETKPAILAAIATMAQGAGESLAEALLEDATERIKKDYYRREIVKALFG